jgi:prolyl 4-hydroxylase
VGEDHLSRARRRLGAVDGYFAALTEVRDRPSIWVQDGIVDVDEANALLDLGDRAERNELDVAVVHDGTGASFEMAPTLHPVVAQVITRLQGVLGLTSAGPTTLRFRRYRPAERHPIHTDHYEDGELRLVATALVNLSDVEAGGETAFPVAAPGAAVVPRAGRLVAWLNHLDDGTPDPLTLHEGSIVRRGVKSTVTLFVYGPPRAARRQRLVDRTRRVPA